MKPIDKQRYPMTIAEYADAAGTNAMRIYRMVRAGQLRTKPGRPVLVLGPNRKAHVSKRQWCAAVREAAWKGGLPRHRWTVDEDGALRLLKGPDRVETVPRGVTMWALESAREKIAALGKRV